MPQQAPAEARTVEPDEVGMRVDLWLHRHFPQLTRRQAQQLLEAGLVACWPPRGAAFRPRKGASVDHCWRLALLGELSARALGNAELELETLLLHPEFLVVNKPAGLPSVALRGQQSHCLASAVLARYPELQHLGFGEREPGLVHRLDTYTSGCILVARTPASFELLRRQLEGHLLYKSYLALTLSPQKDSGWLESSFSPHPKDRRRVQLGPAEEKGKLYRTRFQVLGHGPRYCLIRAEASPAYRHQVRAHLASAGAPLLGDTLYGGPPWLESPRFALHAYELAGTDSAGAEFRVRAEPPEDFARVLGEEGLLAALAKAD